MRTKVVSIVAVIALLVSAVFLAQGIQPVAAQGTPTPAPAAPANPDITRTVSVTGLGEVSATPDQATIYLGVRTQADTADEALEENNTRMTALLSTLRGAGVAARDIKTSDFSIYPRYAEREVNNTLPIIGYEVSNSVQVTVRDIANLGSVLDAAVEAGGNQVSGISFGFNDPSALVEQAREQAMANARANAEQLAGLADVELGTVVTISEGINNYPMPIYRESMAGADMASAVPIESGTSSVSVTVNVTYELVP